MMCVRKFDLVCSSFDFVAPIMAIYTCLGYLFLGKNAICKGFLVFIVTTAHRESGLFTVILKSTSRLYHRLDHATLHLSRKKFKLF